MFSVVVQYISSKLWKFYSAVIYFLPFFRLYKPLPNAIGVQFRWVVFCSYKICYILGTNILAYSYFSPFVDYNRADVTVYNKRAFCKNISVFGVRCCLPLFVQEIVFLGCVCLYHVRKVFVVVRVLLPYCLSCRNIAALCQNLSTCAHI